MLEYVNIKHYLTQQQVVAMNCSSNYLVLVHPKIILIF